MTVPGLLPSKEGISIMAWIDSAENEPTAAELAAIEMQWPLIEAELALLDAEITALRPGGLSPLDWRRLRRAGRAVLAARLRLVTAPTSGTVRGAAS